MNCIELYLVSCSTASIKMNSNHVNGIGFKHLEEYYECGRVQGLWLKPIKKHNGFTGFESLQTERCIKVPLVLLYMCLFPL